MNQNHSYEQYQWHADHKESPQYIREDFKAKNKRMQFQIQNLEDFEDDKVINLEISIPILKAVGIFIAIQSIQSAKTRLQHQDGGQNCRLRLQAKFLYYLWQLINEEEIDCRQLKQIIKLTINRDPNQLKQILLAIYNSQEKVNEYIQASVALLGHQQKKNDQDNYFSFDQKKSCRNYSIKSKNNLEATENSNIASPIKQKSELKRSPLRDTSNFLYNNFNYTLQLSADQEKQLVSRLYKNDQYKIRQQQKRQMEQRRQKQQLEQCTFKPNIAANRGKSVGSQRPKQIKGYEKAISRLKAGTKKSRLDKQLREHKPIGQNYERLRQKSINPPKFLNRQKKQEEKILFIISFDLGRYKTNVKIRQGDTEESVAQRLCKIYSLKQEFYNQICQIVRNQLQIYYQELYENESGVVPPFPAYK